MFPYWNTPIRLAFALALAASSAAAQNHWKESPNVGQPAPRLTFKERFYLFSYRSIEPSAWGKSAFTAAIAQWRDSPPEWGQGMKGYGNRYGHRMLTRGVENGIGFGVAEALRQDGRYFRDPSGSFWHRVGSALEQTVTARTMDGNRTFPAWRVAGNFGAQFVSNAWRPEDQRGTGDTMIRGAVSISYGAAANVFKEFWPDIKRRVFRRP